MTKHTHITETSRTVDLMGPCLRLCHHNVLPHSFKFIIYKMACWGYKMACWSYKMACWSYKMACWSYKMVCWSYKWRAEATKWRAEATKWRAEATKWRAEATKSPLSSLRFPCHVVTAYQPYISHGCNANCRCGFSLHITKGDMACKPEWTPITTVYGYFKYIVGKVTNSFFTFL